MKARSLLVCSLLALSFGMVIRFAVRADTLPEVLFSEVLTKDVSGQKFIELYNLTDEIIDLDGWKIQRALSCSGAASATTVVALKGEIQPRGNFLVAKAEVTGQPDIEHSLSNLCPEYGYLRLLDDSGVLQDAFGWGESAASVEPTPLVKTNDSGETINFVSGESFKRRVDEDGHLIDTDDSSDWFISASPSPNSTSPPSLTSGNFEPSTGNLESGNVLAESADTKSDKPSAKLTISELFIDPDKPLTDAEDEFVELFNPTNESVDLEDYVLQTGSSFSYKFTLPSISVGSGKYLALFSIDTGLVLSNSGGGARLVGPNGQVIFETPAYSKAKTDYSWADINGTWQWTSVPTPNAANIAGTEDGDNTLSPTNSGKVLAATSASDGRTIYEDPPAGEEQINTAVVAGVGGMALLYAGYEYRYDLGNWVHKFKKYLKSRRGGGTPA